jgi:hypothetical protein
MGDFSIRPLPDMITPGDAQMFRTLEQMVDGGYSLKDVLETLARHMGMIRVLVCQPHDAPPDGSRLVMMPLVAAHGYVADAYAILPPVADSLAAAAQLSVFAPILAACVSQYWPV